MTDFRVLAQRLTLALGWCSGSKDFSPGGEAAGGWEKDIAPLIRETELALAEKPDDSHLFVEDIQKRVSELQKQLIEIDLEIERTRLRCRHKTSDGKDVRIPCGGGEAWCPACRRQFD